MARTSTYLIKLTPDESKTLEQEAQRRGVTKAALIRAGLVLVGGRPPRATEAIAAQGSGK